MNETVHVYFCAQKCHNLQYNLFVGNEFVIAYLPERTVYVQKQLRSEVWRENAFPAISFGMSVITKKPLAYNRRR